MFEFKADPRNLKVVIKIQKQAGDQKKAIRKAFYEIGKRLVAATNKAILKKPKHGKTYIIKGRKHTASAPGEAPANLTGNLRKSLDFEVRGSSQMLFGVQESFGNRKSGQNGVIYGRALELGYQPRNLAARSYLIASIRENQKNTQVIFERNLRESLGKLGTL